MVMGMGKAAVDGTVCVYHILGSSGSSTGVFWSSFATASAAPSSLHTHHARHTGTPAAAAHAHNNGSNILKYIQHMGS